MKWMNVVVALSVSANAWAALPPIWETRNEVKAIVDSEKVFEALSAKTAGVVSSIVRLEDREGGYRIQAGECHLRAVIVRGKLAPGQFGSLPIVGVKISAVVCK